VIYHQDAFISMGLEPMPTRTNRDGGVMPLAFDSAGIVGDRVANSTEERRQPPHRGGTVTPLASPRCVIFTAPVELNEDTYKAI
jgi:hypothetical protein